MTGFANKDNIAGKGKSKYVFDNRNQDGTPPIMLAFYKYGP
ncbi:hypothetical protein [Methanosarcina sp. MSH10X1]|nr:hypothetical protein [Methanosarcina sp. MSH10X1]